MDDTTVSAEAHGRKVVIVGQGYVGLPLAMRAVAVGHEVIGYETSKHKVSMLAAANSYIDDISDDDLADALATGRYLPSETHSHMEGFDVAVIAVPTPLLAGIPDTSSIESAATTVGKFVTPGSLVVLESTTYPGTTEELVAPILEGESGLIAGKDFSLGYSPERIDPGNKTWTLETTPKVVAGMNQESLDLVESFYRPLVEETVPVTGLKEAELTKLLENTFRHVNIALINELAMHARSLDIDLWEVIRAAETKPFGFMPFYPGPGVGGHCLPVDPTFLSWRFERQLGSTSRFVELANDINEHMPQYVVSRLQTGLNGHHKPVNGSRILVLGVAYKKNSNDARETPTNGVIEGLLNLGAEVSVHDPHVTSHEHEDSVHRVDQLTAAELAASDAVILLTDHDDFDYDLVEANAGYILDTRHRLTGEGIEHL